jgi:hypothetical protein
VLALQELGVYAADDIVARTRNSGSLNSSLSSGGAGQDESSTLDGSKDATAGSAPGQGRDDATTAAIIAKDNDRIKVMARALLACLCTSTSKS